MRSSTVTLPATPHGSQHWSIVTLAQHLCVPAAVVNERLIPCPEGGMDESPDLHSTRPFITYLDARSEWLGDCWLTEEAAERIAAALPVGIVARRIVEAGSLGDDDATYRLALHIVEHSGGVA